MEFTAEFTVIGEDQDPDDSKQVGPLPPGTVFPIDQDLFDQVEDWRPGGKLGEAHGAVTVTRKGRAMCVVTFEFDNGTVMVQGLLAAEGKKLSGGTLAVTGGTGEFERSAGRVDMESQNPKRWSFVL